jgi:hypothetical protein
VTGTAGDGETGWTWSSLAGLAGLVGDRLGVAVTVALAVGGGTVVDEVADGPGVPLLLVGAAEPTTTAGPMTPSVSPVLAGLNAASTMPAVISRAPPTARATFRMASTLSNTEHSQIRPG